MTSQVALVVPQDWYAINVQKNQGFIIPVQPLPFAFPAHRRQDSCAFCQHCQAQNAVG